MSSEHKKVCFKCGRELGIDCFYVHKEMADGHLNKCKECTLLDGRLRLERDGNKIRAYDRSRPKRSRKTSYAVNHPSKYRAKNKLNNAVRDGRVLKGLWCERCWSVENIQGHHTDYSKPLSVIWLCARCHAQSHFLDRASCSEVASLRCQII